MRNAGIYHDDILVVDRSLKASSKDIIVAILNSEFIVRRLITNNKKTILYPENENEIPILISSDADFEIWGVVTFVIHNARAR